jgi:hypothetical protein
MKLFIIVVGLLGFAFAAIAIKMFFIKGSVFTKSCSSVDVHGQKIGCSCGDMAPGEKCDKFEEHHGKGYNTHHHISTLKLKV